jgi:hypothetical protein
MSSIFPSNLRYLNKGDNSNERKNFSNWWKEEIDLFGVEVDYYTNMYASSAADNTYGEHPTATFADPVKLVMMADLTQTALVFSKFGLMGDDDLQAVIHIDTFKSSMSGISVENIVITEPKAGDVFQLEEYGDDRPGERNGKYFEITERLDEEISQINALMGHYVWLIKAKRHDYSWEPGLSGEKSLSLVTDDNFTGRLSGGDTPKTVDKPYDGSADEEAGDNFTNPYDDVYGDY